MPRKSAAMRFVRLILLVVAFSLSALLFQNCSKAQFYNSASWSKIGVLWSNGGNGNGYDGKIYVAGKCTEASLPQRRIRINGAQASLLREQCQDLIAPLSCENAEPGRVQFINR